MHATRRLEFTGWLRGAIEGRSFVSTGPLLLFEIDGQGPGARFDKAGPGPHAISARIRLRCEVTPVTHAQLIVNGQAVQSWTVPSGQQQGVWWEVERRLELREASWIAARSWSMTPSGQPDGEAHTNPIYVYLDGRAPYRRTSLETWLGRIEGQLSVHRQREFAEKARVLDYFEQARSTLLRIREHGGLGADERPGDAVQSAATKAVRPDGKAPVPRSRVSEPETSSQPVPPKPLAEDLKPIETLADFQLDERAAELTGQRNDPAELKQALIALVTASWPREPPDMRPRLVFALGRGLKRAGARLSAQDQFGPVVAQLLDEFRQSARRVALDDRSPEQTRVRAIEQLGCLTLERVHEPLSRLSDAGQPTAVQIAAIGALADFTDPLATEILLRHWRQYAPAVRGEAFRAMLRYEDRTLAWLRAAERGEVSLAEADSAERQSLLSHRSEEVAALARKVFGNATERGRAK